MKLTPEQISKFFSIGNAITDESDKVLFYEAAQGDFNALGNFSTRAWQTGNDKALEFLIDTKKDEVTV